MDTSAFQFITSALILLVGLYLIYLKSYFQKKAENVATISDVGRITKIVEETKKQFNAELELLRSNLSLYGENFNSIKDLERNALIEINTKYSAWLNSLLNFSLVFYSLDFYEPLIKQPLHFAEKHLEFNMAEDNLNLHIHDSEVMTKIGKLKHETYELHKSVLINLSSFLSNCKVYTEIKRITPIEKLFELNHEYNQKQQPIIDSSLADMTHFYSKILPHQIDFIKILNFRIYQILTKVE